MKKTLLFTRFLTIVGLYFIFSCTAQMEQEPVPVDDADKLTKDIETRNGVLAFKTTEVYEKMIHEIGKVPKGVPLEQHLDKWEKQYDFTSMRRTKLTFKNDGSSNARLASETADFIQDTYLATLLSPEGIIRIDEWYFKVDLKNEKVYALPVTHGDLLSVLKETKPQHDKIRIFSTNDDVLDLIAGGSLGESSRNMRTALFCSESGASSREAHQHIEYDGDRRLDCKVVYQKAGIYFSLQAKVQNQNYFGGIWWAQEAPLSLNYVVEYKPKCKSWASDSGIIYNDFGTNDVNHRAYESARGLHKYYYSAQFGNTGAGIYSDWLTINNY